MAQDRFRLLLLQLKAEHERQLDDLQAKNRRLKDGPTEESEAGKTNAESPKQVTYGDEAGRPGGASLDDRVLAPKQLRENDALLLSAAGDLRATASSNVAEESCPQCILPGEVARDSRIYGLPAEGGGKQDSSGVADYEAARSATRSLSFSSQCVGASEDKLSKSALLLSALLRQNREPQVLLIHCFREWRRIVKTMRRPLKFEVLKALAPGRTSALASKTTSFQAEVMEVSMSHDEEIILRDDGRCSKILISPGGALRISWDLASTWLLAYDIIMIPMSTFGPKREGFLVAMEWFTLVFWTMDMFMSCITGVIEDGVVVLSPLPILKAYLRSWFWLDVIVVIPDWVFTIIGLSGGSESSAGGGGQRLLRIVRIMRTVRLLRLAKLQRILTLIRDQIDSEVMFVLISIMKLVSMVLVLNHIIAALWWSIGTLGRDGGRHNWIDSERIQDESIEYRYLTSLHWSICMFTPGSMSVQPHNALERGFAVLVLVSGMVVFTAFISSMTAAITQLKNMQGNKAKDLWMLRRFLRQHDIHKELSFRVLRYVDNILKSQKTSKISTDKVWPTLSILSHQLRTEVQYEVSFSLLIAHPFLEYVASKSKVTMFKLVGYALTNACLGLSDVLFSVGGMGTHMHFLADGGITYAKTNSDEDDEAVVAKNGDWFCEPVLWTEWHHLGTAHATLESDLIDIHAENFVKVLIMDAIIADDLVNYAGVFVKRLCTIPYGRLTDFSSGSTSRFTAYDLVEEVIEDRPRVQPRLMHSQTDDNLEHRLEAILNDKSTSWLNGISNVVKKKLTGDKSGRVSSRSFGSFSR